MAKKKIVFCCDGTKNEFGIQNTNVVRLYSVLQHFPGQQIAFYHPGVGSMGAPSALTPFAKMWTTLFGLAFGYGLSQQLVDLYSYLMQVYEEGDDLFVFGFSRGAYTARALCSMLRVFGLIRCNDAVLIPYAIRLLKKYVGPIERTQKTKTISDQFKATFSSQEVKPHFVGVWDTVSSVGGLHNPLKVPFSAYNPDIQIGRHAVAIDERRAFYRTNLWRSPDQVPPWNIQQVWFAGVHSDVGGGYPEPKESGLSKIALEWMVREAIAAGLLVDEGKLAKVLGGDPYFGKPDPRGELHDSMRGWRWAEIIPRRHYSYASHTTSWIVPRAHWRTIDPGSWVHETVFQRRSSDPKYRPANLQSEDQYQVARTGPPAAPPAASPPLASPPSGPSQPEPPVPPPP